MNEQRERESLIPQKGRRLREDSMYGTKEHIEGSLKNMIGDHLRSRKSYNRMWNRWDNKHKEIGKREQVQIL